jgi:hypothetical protein
MKALASSWERAFLRQIPQYLDDWVKDNKRLLREFQDKIQQFATELSAAFALDFFEEHIGTYTQVFTELLAQMKKSVGEHQLEGNRAYSPAVQRRMTNAYQGITNLNGTGSFAQTKLLMSSHVDVHGETIFRAAGEAVMSELESISQRLFSLMEEQARLVRESLQSDYKLAFGQGSSRKLSTTELHDLGRLRRGIEGPRPLVIILFVGTEG